ncbi:MAG TPA: glycosyltransferase [Anaerolineaceae bacterium]|nr:glycosyltransferase [Anaerolineaceae bacterium]
MTTNSKKIVLIGPMPPYRGGIARFTASLAEELMDIGHDVKVISYRKQYPKLLYPGKTEKDYSQNISAVRTEFLFSPLNLEDWNETFKQIKCFQPDLVIYQWWTTFWAPATSWLIHQVNKAGINIKILVHNAFPHDSTWLDAKLTAWALRDASSFVTMTEAQANRLRSVVSSQAEILTAPHPVYRQFPNSGLSKVEVRKKLGLPLEVPIALFFGFVRPYKGLRILIDAMGILKSKGSRIHLVVAGEFWDDQDVYENQIAELGIKDMVTIRADYIPDSEAGLYFESADLFVAPYIGGTQSGSIKQAMGYGLPMVVTDVMTDHLVLDYPGGLSVVKSGDPEAFAEKIKEMLLSKFDTKSKNGNVLSNSWQPLLDVLLRV